MKKMVFWGNLSVASGETLAWPDAGQDFYFNTELMMDVFVNIKTLSGGTSPSITLSVQEAVDAVFFETANSGAKSSTGKFILAHHIDQSSKGWPALGRGYLKQIVSTTSGSPSTVSADVYAVLYDYHSV